MFLAPELYLWLIEVPCDEAPIDLGRKRLKILKAFHFVFAKVVVSLYMNIIVVEA